MNTKNHFAEADDLVAAIPVATKTNTTATTTATVAKNPTLAETEPDDDGVDLVADANELKAKPTLVSVLPKEPNVTTRFALVPGIKARVANVHFLSTIGKGMTVVCPGAGCPECAKGGDHNSRRKIAALALRYETNNDGKFPAGTTVPSISIGYVNLSPSAFSEMSICPSEDEGETIYGIDFKAVKKNNGIGWTFGRAGKPLYIKTNLEAAVTELTGHYADGKMLKSRLGKSVTVLELKGLLAGTNPVADTAATLADIEDMD